MKITTGVTKSLANMKLTGNNHNKGFNDRNDDNCDHGSISKNNSDNDNLEKERRGKERKFNLKKKLVRQYSWIYIL